MAVIKPFLGIRYNPERFASQMAQLVAPPYDVIDKEQQNQLYDKHPNNIVHLDLNRTYSSDCPDNNIYNRARRHLMDWLADGIFKIEDAPAIYVHYQDFVDESGAKHTRRGFISLAKLANYEEGVVLPHERTLKGPKEDRLKLMKATECNMSQVFFLYDDPQSAVDELLASAKVESAVVDITTPEDGIRHRLWPVYDEKVHGEVAKILQHKPLLIADGHHRYETALAYRDFRRETAEEAVECAPYDYTMAFMVNIHDPGLQVFATHRVVHSLKDNHFDQLKHKLTEAPYFKVESLEPSLLKNSQTLQQSLLDAGEKYPSFVLIAPMQTEALLVSFIGDISTPVFDDETPEEVRKLDVAILHEVIFDRLLGIDKEAQAAKTNLLYIKGFEDAINAAHNPDHQVVVLMNPTPVEQVNSVCLSGGKMPQKSTFFYPKILSGLVINPL